MMDINQASVLAGGLRSRRMWDNNNSARINPIDGKRWTSSQLKFIALKSFFKKVPTQKTAAKSRENQPGQCQIPLVGGHDGRHRFDKIFHLIDHVG